MSGEGLVWGRSGEAERWGYVPVEEGHSVSPASTALIEPFDVRGFGAETTFDTS